MKLLPRNAGKWIVPAIVVAAIVAAAPSDQGDMAAAVSKAGRIQTAAAAPARAAQRPSEPASVEMASLAQSEPEAVAEIGNIFGVTSWYVPPPPPPPAPPPPPPVPTAPPLPFTYLGSYEDAPTQLTILVKGERIYTVAAGDVIDGTYRVDRVVPGMVELTYLPLNIKQMLSTGGAL
ncbi:MAG TPA: hypothetical protein VFF26_02565 [Gallionella sp.]|nr:hypothetical protein [Gallionella sp.]